MGRAVAIFDLDGTITTRDTFARYLLGYLKRHPRRWPKALPLAMAGAGFASALIGNTRMKKVALRAVLAGARRVEIEAWSARFVSRCLETMLRRGAMTRIEAHRRAGHRLILATASPDLYVEPLARRLGFTLAVCTRVAWTCDGRVSGEIDGDNLRGAQKLAAVRRVISTDATNARRSSSLIRTIIPICRCCAGPAAASRSIRRGALPLPRVPRA
jgi:phosphatidylglycerophosphatase C